MNVYLNPIISKKTNYLSVEIYQFAHKYFGLKTELEAWKQFTYEELEEYPSTLTFMEIFLPWFLYSWESSEGENMAAEYLMEHELGDIEKSFIGSCINNKYSFYQITEVEPGRYLEMTDLLSRKKHVVFESTATKVLNPGDTIFSKVASVDELNFLVGTSSYIIPEKFHDRILKLRRKKSEFERIDVYYQIVAEIIHDEQLTCPHQA